ncbi:alkaline phosphatase family protein [Meiothermus cerbereus]|uniref:alkaline phosphatase family protein n=1 Tax=Meiothermus cerbereus TaxID=65552 RepID=UPI000481CBCF|nr:alkaline phosphatase family protein [Meiothermus cerbereus]
MARLLYITIDGLRPDALEAAHLPTLLTLMQEGASTLCARSVFPSITLPCHMSIFHSLPPERHNVLTQNLQLCALGIPYAPGPLERGCWFPV